MDGVIVKVGKFWLGGTLWYEVDVNDVAVKRFRSREEADSVCQSLRRHPLRARAALHARLRHFQDVQRQIAAAR